MTAAAVTACPRPWAGLAAAAAATVAVALASAPATAAGAGVAAAAADRLTATVHFVEPSQDPETVDLAAGPGRAATVDISMGYDIDRIEFSRPIARARSRQHVALIWSEPNGDEGLMDVRGFMGAFAMPWTALPCRQQACSFAPTNPAPRSTLFLPNGKVRLAPALAGARAIAADPTVPAARRAEARAAVARCARPPAARPCVALAVEDEIEVLVAGARTPRRLWLEHEVD